MAKSLSAVTVYQCAVCLRQANEEVAEAEGWLVAQKANAPEGVLFVRCNRHGQETQAEVLVTNAALDLAVDLGVDLADVEGTGKGGTIIVRDVRKAAKEAGSDA